MKEIIAFSATIAALDKRTCPQLSCQLTAKCKQKSTPSPSLSQAEEGPISAHCSLYHSQLFTSLLFSLFFVPFDQLLLLCRTSFLLTILLTFFSSTAFIIQQKNEAKAQRWWVERSIPIFIASWQQFSWTNIGILFVPDLFFTILLFKWGKKRVWSMPR